MSAESGGSAPSAETIIAALPEEPVDRYAIDLWQPSEYADGYAESVRFEYHKNSLYEDIFPGEGRGAVILDQWLIYRSGRCTGRRDKWSSMKSLRPIENYFASERAAKDEQCRTFAHAATLLRARLAQLERSIATLGGDAGGESPAPASAMLSEACAALGIEPDGDEAERWAAALGAMRERRAALPLIGFCVLDRVDDPVSLSVFEETANDHRDRLNAAAGPQVPFRVVPVGPVQEMVPFAFGVADKNGEALPQHTYRTRDGAEYAAARLTEEAPGRLDGAPFEAVPLYRLVSPPDRPAEAPALTPGETESAVLEGPAEDLDVAPGGGEGETGQPAAAAKGKP